MKKYKVKPITRLSTAYALCILSGVEMGYLCQGLAVKLAKAHYYEGYELTEDDEKYLKQEARLINTDICNDHRSGEQDETINRINRL